MVAWQGDRKQPREETHMPHDDSNSTPDNEQPQFPENAWVGVLTDYYNLICNTTEAPDELIWAGIIGVLSSIAAGCVRMRWCAGWMKPNLFLLLLGATSKARKTTAMTDAVEIVLNRVRRRGSHPGEPDPFEVVRGQGSGEGLLEAIADRPWWPPGVNKGTQAPTVQNGRGALYLFDEYGAFLEKATRDQAGNFIGFHLQLFDAPEVMQLSTRSNKIVCTNAYGTILAASTPEYLAKGMSEALVYAGFVNRYLFISGQRTSPIPRRPPIDAQAHEALLARIRANVATLAGSEMVLSPEAEAINAQKYIIDFNKTEESPLLEAATDRGPTLAMRLAMVLAFADGTAVISGAHMQAAWDVVAYSRSVVKRLLDRVKHRNFEQAEAKLIRAARKVAGANNGTFARSEVRARLHGGSGLTAKEFTVVWDALVLAEDILPAPSTIPQAEPRFVLSHDLAEG